MMPKIVAGLRNQQVLDSCSWQHPARRTNGLLGVDYGVVDHGVSHLDSFAKNAVAFFKILRLILAMASSRSNSRMRCWSVVSFDTPRLASVNVRPCSVTNLTASCLRSRENTTGECASWLSPDKLITYHYLPVHKIAPRAVLFNDISRHVYNFREYRLLHQNSYPFHDTAKHANSNSLHRSD